MAENEAAIMEFMHWSYDDLLACPADVVEAVLRLIEKRTSKRGDF